MIQHSTIRLSLTLGFAIALGQAAFAQPAERPPRGGERPDREALRKQIASAQAQRQMVNVQNNEEFESRMNKLIELVDMDASDEDILQQLYRLRIDYHARSARLNYHLEKIQKLRE